MVDYRLGGEKVRVGSTSSKGSIDGPTQYDCTGWQLAGRYEFIRVLGTGGTSRVHLARDMLLSRQVAVKTILPALVDNSVVRSRIDRECRLHAAIGAHPNIVTLYDKLEEDGRIYLVMEYVRGEVLADILSAKSADNSDRLTVDDAISLVLQILKGLICIHEHGILHRDIKTSNILIQQQPEGKDIAKLMDFGIARLEESGEALTRLTQLDCSGPGTPVYMAPERIDPSRFGETVQATDLYSVGVILYQLLSDGPPFQGTITEIFNGHLTQPVELSRLGEDVSSGLRDIIVKALEKDPGDRFQDARAFATALGSETESHEHCLTRGSHESDLIVPATESPDQPEPAPTLLAPEPKIMDIQPPVSEKNNRYGIILMVVALSLMVIILGARFFLSNRGDTPVSPEAAVTTDDVDPGIVEDPIVEGRIAEPVQTGDELKTSAMEVLQTSRTSGKTTPTPKNGSQQDKPAAEDSDWQILESDARRIDR